MPSREPELYKDKVEVSLDGRQIFYLFFGGSVIVGIVFVLGVLVGRRVEARGHVDHAQTHSATDPLAALDRLEGSGGLSFQGALGGGGSSAPAASANANPAPVDKVIDDLAKQRAANPPAPPAPAAKPADKPADKPSDKPADKPSDKSADKAKADKATPLDGPVVKPEADRPKADKPKADKPKAEAAADADDAPKTRYTLQLSAFQDRGEAEAFLARMKDQGYQASITQAEVEGKGTYYRVRLGTYKSMEAANKARSELEGAGKSATVMKL